MQASFDLESSHWGVQVATLQRRLGLEAKAVLTDQSRLFFQQVIDLTPPKTLAQGRARTGADIGRVMKPFNTTAFRSKRLADIVARRDYASFESFMKYVDNPALRGATAGPFSEEKHQGQRNRRGGIGRRDRKHFVIGGSDVSALKKYTKRKLANVGFAKSGWLLALWATGGSTPSWISNHVQRGQGAVENALDQPDPFITARNVTPWADDRAEGTRIIRYAVRYRIKAMETYLKRALERAAASAGIDVTAA